jgi:hypothetical protein
MVYSTKQVTLWAPFLFVDKKDKLRMCINYCALNKITIKNNYPLLHIDDLLDWFNGVQYFNQIDLKLGYYQIRFVEEDVEKTIMKTKYGLHEFLVMPFNLCNALSTFTTFMNSIFHEKLGWVCDHPYWWYPNVFQDYGGTCETLRKCYE